MARIVAENGMDAWSDEQVVAVANGEHSQRQQAAHLTMRQRANAQKTAAEMTAYDASDLR